MNKKNQKMMTAAMMALVLSSCGNKSDAVQPDNAVMVKTEAVVWSPTASGRKYAATIEESAGTEVSFPGTGTVSKVLVKNGQRVQKGQLLATLDETTLMNAYRASRSMLTQAEDAYDRMQLLHSTNSISEMQWVEVQSRVEQARSAEQIARRALDDAQLVAPASGIVANRNIEPGQNVLPGLSIMRIVEIDQVKVNISVPEKEISSISSGSEVDVCVHALGDTHFKGIVTEKNVTANLLSRSYTIKVTVDNPGQQLMPGMICEATLYSTDAAGNSICLPIDAVQLSEKNTNFVWIDHNGRAQKRYVSVGGVTATGVTIKAGLKAGENVIVEGQQKVSEGTKVVRL